MRGWETCGEGGVMLGNWEVEGRVVVNCWDWISVSCWVFGNKGWENNCVSCWVESNSGRGGELFSGSWLSFRVDWQVGGVWDIWIGGDGGRRGQSRVGN